MIDLDAIFGRTHEVSAAQECARAAVVFLFGLVVVRVAGRRAFGKWGALDIVVSIVVGSNLSRAMTGNAPLLGTLAATALIMALHYAFALGAARSRLLSRLFEGGAVEIARDGRLLRGRRVRHTVSQADIDEALRGQGLENVSGARRVTLEPSGKITVLK